MKEAGWIEIDQPRPGAVVTWPEYEGHEHIGFVLDNNEYISHALVERSPKIHQQKLADGRTPSAYYWHPTLDQG